MPTSQKVQIDTYDFGASLTAPTLENPLTGDTITDGTAATCNEQSADSGVYIADYVGADASHLVPAGTYRLKTAVNGKPLKRWATFTGVDGEVVYARVERTAVLDADTQAMVAAFNAMRSGNVFTAPALANAPGGGGSGTGARTVTITVNDGTTALQNAVVRLSEGLNTYRTLTNASGVAVFNVDDATYTVAVTKSGYTYAGTTLVVDGTETAAYSMTAVSVTPPTNPDLSAVVVLCLGTDFEPETGVTIDLRIVTFPSGSTNTAYPGLKKTATSNGSGIATLYAPKGSVCEWKRGREDSWTEITIDDADQTNVTSIIGSRY